MEKKRVKIILVDDHLVYLEGVVRYLSGLGYVDIVGVFTRPGEALDLISIMPCDVLFTDMRMEVMNGYALIKKAKKVQQDLKTVVITYEDNLASLKVGLSTYKIDGYSGKELMLSDFQKILEDVYYNNKTYISPRMKEQLYSNLQNGTFWKKVNLTQREIEILSLIAAEKESTVIAQELGISIHTVNNHRKSILAKTNSKNAVGAIDYARKNGLL